MNRRSRSLLVLLLCLTLLLACVSGCASGEAVSDETPEPAVQPEPAEETPETEDPAPAFETPSIVVTEKEPVVLPEPIVPEPTTAYPEALALLTYLSALTEEDAAAYDAPMTGEQAVRALGVLGLSDSGISAADTSVTGAQMLCAALRLLGYPAMDEADAVSQAEALCLTRGFWQFDASAALTTEQGANILLSALRTDTVSADGTSTGEKLAARMGVSHVVLTEYAEPFNRPGSTWVSADTGEAVIGEFTATPIAVFGDTTSWCDLLDAIGYAKDDPANDQHIPKYFRNCVDGGLLTERFWKHHNGDDGHSDCANDFTGGQDAMLEVYEIDSYEYRNVIMNTFLGISDEKGLTIYGFERAEYGPYTDETRPTAGAYITHSYWNAYGMGNGYEVVGPADIRTGTLEGGNILTTTIDGVEYTNGQSYSYGKKLTTAPANAGKEYSFLFDRYGFLLGCMEASSD